MLIAMFAAAILVQDVDPPGRYNVESATGSCSVRLQESLPGLPDAFVDGDAQSGFAFATPGCPAGLEALSLWRWVRETGALHLIDGAGETLLSANPDGRDWVAQAEDDALVRLTRD